MHAGGGYAAVRAARCCTYDELPGELSWQQRFSRRGGPRTPTLPGLLALQRRGQEYQAAELRRARDGFGWVIVCVGLMQQLAPRLVHPAADVAAMQLHHGLCARAVAQAHLRVPQFALFHGDVWLIFHVESEILYAANEGTPS